jgi:hypothetical protein
MNQRRAFTQADVRRLYKGAAEAGVTITVEIGPDGTMRGIPCNPVLPPIGQFDIMSRIAGMKL